MTPVGPCPACGEALQGRVRFCPFCGAAQQSVAAAPPPAAVPPAAVEPVMAAPRPVPPVVPVQQPVGASVPPRPVPLRVVPVVAPAPAPASPGPPRPVRAPRTPAQRRARAAAWRKLAVAAVILVCAVILWRHLTGGPHGTLVVRLARRVDGAVQVDGAGAGSAGAAIALDAGRHVVGFAAPGWSTPEIAVRIRDGETRAITLWPQPDPALVALQSVPAGARLTLDGRRLGRAPAALSLSAGVHAVQAAAPGYQTLAQTLTLAPGEHRRVVLALQPVPVRRLQLVAPPDRWSDPVRLAAGERFALLFAGRIRLRLGGAVLLLDGGVPVDLGARAGDAGLSVTAVDGAPVPVELLVHASNAPD